MRFLIFFLVITTTAFSTEEEQNDALFLSTPEQISTLKSESSTLIGGLISPLSGQLALRQTDLIAKGAQNVILNRVYIPPYIPSALPNYKRQNEEYRRRDFYYYLLENYKGWQFYPHTKLEFNSRTAQVRLSDPSGITLDFKLSGPNYTVISLVHLPYALTNTAGDEPSGKYDLRNTRIHYHSDIIIVDTPDSTTRFYRSQKGLGDFRYLYLLHKEILPNGKILRYNYNGQGQLLSVESLDPQERYVYASIQIAGSPPDGRCHFTSATGMIADYEYHQKTTHWKIKEKTKNGNQTTGAAPFLPPVLTAISSPTYRHELINYTDNFLLEGYSGKEHTFKCQYNDYGTEFRTHQLLFPLGPNGELCSTYNIQYDKPIAGVKEGATGVRFNDGTMTHYRFSKSMLLTAIQSFAADGSLQKEKCYTWTPGHLLEAITLKDGAQNVLYKKSFAYDRFGNPTLETFTGDLTGSGEQETYTITRTFSEEGKNLLLREENEDGKEVTFSYLPSTNLITSKLIKDHGRILLREFSIYDDCHNLTQKISDDGNGENKDDLSGVTQRTLTTYLLRQSAPFLHMPEWAIDTYWEKGTEKLLKKRHFLYDAHGNIAEEETYDAEGKYVYTLYKTYNERGDLLSETNPSGQKADYTYDAKGHTETSLNFSNRLRTSFRYDPQGRLREQTEQGNEGITHTRSFDYDPYDRKIQEIDSFHNSTRYTYDPVTHKVIRTDFPSILSVDGPSAVTTSSYYDPFGRALTKTDANGNTTTYRYNTYGSPVEILYPHGGKESFRYAKNGDLISHTDLDGLTIRYQRDILGRVLVKTYISGNETIAEETFTYSGFNLLSETDKEGNLTQYTYDGAGRKIREDFCGHTTEFTYDSLGWLAIVCKHNGENTLLIHYIRDLEGRITEERKTDTTGNLLYRICYSYDADGNQQTITRPINRKEAVDTFEYDSFRRQIAHHDAQGYSTLTHYNEHFTNSLGQKVLQIAVTDPRYVTHLETQDALSRTIKKEILNSHQTLISCQEFLHDPAGNLLLQKDHVYENNAFKETQTIKYTHTSDHRLESFTRGFGTKEERTTAYTYFSSGKTATKTLPDGVTLTYHYHPLGYMDHLDSSDGKIHHAFAYDLLGHLKSATDENDNTTLTRELDPFGNILQEQFPHGLAVQKEYDAFNRLTSLTLDREGTVVYTYDPLFLRSVSRISNTGNLLYSHTYEEYDLDGNLLSENLIGHLGQVLHATNPKGLKTRIASPYFSQECVYDSTDNLTQTLVNGIEEQFSYDELSQLSSEKSIANSSIYVHDSLYNRTQSNNTPRTLSALNELLSLGSTFCAYDLNGNQVLKKTPTETLHFTYDPLNRLTAVSSEKKHIHFTYDPLGRRLSKVVAIPGLIYGWRESVREHYLYHGQNEVGAFVDHSPKNLKVLGLAKHKNDPATISIELDGKPFAPLLDVQGNVRRLIDLYSRKLTGSYDFTAFGQEKAIQEYAFNPWRFASKRLDPELGLIYFGKRYYDPEFARWITTDPAGFADSVNLYQYVFNNPFRYRDPDGQFAFVIPLLVWGAELVLPSLSAYAAPLIYGAISGAVAYGGYKAVEALNKKEDTYSAKADYDAFKVKFDAEVEEEQKKKYNTNPFDGPVTDDVVVVDEDGNAINVPPGNWLTGTKDGKWIQEMKPGGGPKGEPTGQRKDGGGHPPPKHTDIRANKPHAHVPGVTNPDGTDWLPLKK